MTISLSGPRSLLLAGAFFGAFTFGAAAQQPAAPAAGAAPAAAPALPPGSPLIGRPDGEAAAKLAPVAGPPLATAADKLPIAKLKVPPGFNIEVYAAGMANARSLAQSDKGTVFVGSRLVDKVYAITNKDGKREVKVLASGLYRPNGVAFHNGTLFIAELSKIDKIDKVDDVIDNPPKPTTIYDNLPKDEAHGWKFIAVGPDNKLYVPVGQPGNNVLHDDAHGQIRRMNLDGTGAEVVRVRRSQQRRLRLESGKQADVLHRQWPRLAVGRRAAGRTQSRHQGRRGLRRAVLLSGQYPRSRIRLGPFLLRLHPAGRPDGTAHRLARHALLHRQHVPEDLQGRDLRGASRLLEPSRKRPAATSPSSS